jgi:hypothetical protein
MPTLFFYNLNGRRRKFESVDKRPGVDARTHHLSWNTSSNSFPDCKHLTRNDFVTDYFRTCTAHVFHYFEICMVGMNNSGNSKHSVKFTGYHVIQKCSFNAKILENLVNARLP